MNETVNKCGNSQDVRLKKEEKDKRYEHKTLRERFAGYNGEVVTEEWDTGEPVGKEIW